MRLLSARRGAALALAGGLLVTYAVLTVRQLAVWRDSPALWMHVLALTPGSVTAHNNLAVWLQDHGRDAEALPHIRAAMAAEREPGAARNALRVGCNAHFLLIRALIALGRSPEVPPAIRMIHAGPCPRVMA